MASVSHVLILAAGEDAERRWVKGAWLLEDEGGVAEILALGYGTRLGRGGSVRRGRGILTGGVLWRESSDSLDSSESELVIPSSERPEEPSEFK